MNIIDRISGALALMQTRLDVARGKDDPAEQILALREALQTAREDLLSVREQVATLVSEKGELEKRLAERAQFDEGAAEFVLTRLPTGSVVRVRKGVDQAGADAPIHVCADCFEAGKRKALQVQDRQPHHDAYHCRGCGSTALIPHDRPAPKPVVIRRRRRRNVLP